MKKLLIITIVSFITCNAMALEFEPQEGFTNMVFLGMNATNVRNSDFDGKIGGVMGFRTDYTLPKAHGTYITLGIDWTMKGGKASRTVIDPLDGTTAQKATAKTNLHYVEIPLRVGFRYNFNKHIGVYGEIGPYFAIGVGGKHKFEVDADGAQWKDIEDANTWKAFKKSTVNANFQRWDTGIGFRVGSEYNQHYNLMLGCDWGFTDMWRDSYRDAMWNAGAPILGKAKNFNFTLAFGFRF